MSLQRAPRRASVALLAACVAVAAGVALDAAPTAGARERTFLVRLSDGSLTAVTLDVPDGTPLASIPLPGTLVKEETPAASAGQTSTPSSSATDEQHSGTSSTSSGANDGAHKRPPSHHRRPARRHARPRHRAPARNHDGSPSPHNPTFFDALPAPNSAASVPNFVIRQFRVPIFLLPIYQAAGNQYGIRWEVLAAINEIESDYGRNLSVSTAGAVGWMQFLPSTWAKYGVDANGDGKRDPYNPVDAIFAAASYLKAAGGDKDIKRAIFAYNHAGWYVDSVLLRAKLIAGVPGDLIGSLTGLTEGRFPVAAHARYADDPVEKMLNQRHGAEQPRGRQAGRLRASVAGGGADRGEHGPALHRGDDDAGLQQLRRDLRPRPRPQRQERGPQAAPARRPRGGRHPDRARRQARPGQGRPRELPDPPRRQGRPADRSEAAPRRLEAARVHRHLLGQRQERVERVGPLDRPDPADVQAAAREARAERPARRPPARGHERHQDPPDRPPRAGTARVPRGVRLQADGLDAQDRSLRAHQVGQRLRALLRERRRHLQDQRHPGAGPPGQGRDRGAGGETPHDPPGHDASAPDHLAALARREHPLDARPRRPRPRRLQAAVRPERQARPGGPGSAQARPVERPDRTAAAAVEPGGAHQSLEVRAAGGRLLEQLQRQRKVRARLAANP